MMRFRLAPPTCGTPCGRAEPASRRSSYAAPWVTVAAAVFGTAICGGGVAARALAGAADAPPTAGAVPVAASSPAPAAQPTVAPCSAAEHRQFDFWLGEWEVHDSQGVLQGTNRITSILGGCALAENWVGAKGLVGTSLNAYSTVDARWHQTWMDASGTVLMLRGGMMGATMRLEGRDVPASGPPLDHRIEWIPSADGRLRQHWQTSTDGGATWTTAFDGLYRRKG